MNFVPAAEIKESVIFTPLNKIGILLKTSFKQLTNKFYCVIIKLQIEQRRNLIMGKTNKTPGLGDRMKGWG